MAISIGGLHSIYGIFLEQTSLFSRPQVRSSLLLPALQVNLGNNEVVGKYTLEITCLVKNNVHQRIYLREHRIVEGGLLFFCQYLDVYAPEKIDQLRLRLLAKGRSLAKKQIQVLQYQTKNRFNLPMKGPLFELGGPLEIWGHRTLPCQFAADFIAVDQRLSEFSTDELPEAAQRRNVDHFCFGKVVMAPAAGKIVASGDGLPDNPTPYDSTATYEQIAQYQQAFSPLHLAGGNYIIIDHGQGEFIYLGHLQKASIKVKAGDFVQRGMPLALCGNSGAGSICSHLHVQLMDGPVPSTANHLPLRFADAEHSIFRRDVLVAAGLPEDLSRLMTEAGLRPLR
jgi:hypothetical protein